MGMNKVAYKGPEFLQSQHRSSLLQPIPTTLPTFSTPAKLSVSALLSTGTTRPFGVATAMEMST